MSSRSGFAPFPSYSGVSSRATALYNCEFQSSRADPQLGASRVDAFYERKKLGIDGKSGGFKQG